MVPRLVTRRIPYWSGGSGSAFTGADATAGSTVAIGGGRWRWRQNFRCVGGNMHFTGTQPVMPRRDGRPWRERDTAQSRVRSPQQGSAWLVAATGAFRRVTWESATRCMKSASTSPVASPQAFRQRATAARPSRAKGSMGFVTIGQNGMVRRVTRLEKRTSVTNFRVRACSPFADHHQESGTCTKASYVCFKRLFEFQTCVRGKIMTPLKKRPPPALILGRPSDRVTNTAVCPIAFPHTVRAGTISENRSENRPGPRTGRERRRGELVEAGGLQNIVLFVRGQARGAEAIRNRNQPIGSAPWSPEALIVEVIAKIVTVRLGSLSQSNCAARRWRG